MKLSRRAMLGAAAILPAASALHGAVSANTRMKAADLADPMTVLPLPPAIPGSHETAHLAGVDLAFWDTGGKGPPVVFLHPATGSGEVWGYQAADFAAKGFRAIGYSRRGFIGSTSGTEDDKRSAAEDLALLLDHLGIATCHVVGTAAGGFAAASFALMYPERVRKLVLACTILAPSERRIGAMIGALREKWYNDLPHDFRELSPSYRAVNPEGQALWNQLHERSRGDSPARNQASGVPADLAAVAGLKMPVLLVAGDSDLIAPPPVARAFRDAIPGSALVVLTECGHSAYWERPRQFNDAVMAFLGQ